MAEQMTDWNLLSAYLDGELSETEAQTLLARLQAEPALAAEWAELQAISQSLKAMPILKAPRNYTLDPAQYGKKPRIIRLNWMLSLAAAVMMVFLGAFYLLQNMEKNAALTTESVGMSAPADEDTMNRAQMAQETLPSDDLPPPLATEIRIMPTPPSGGAAAATTNEQEEAFSMAAAAPQAAAEDGEMDGISMMAEMADETPGRPDEKQAAIQDWLAELFLRLFKFLGEVDD